MQPVEVLLLLQVFFLNFLYIHGYYSGDNCYHNIKKANGKCTAIENCPEAQADLIKRIAPQQCGFEGIVFLVCCVSSTPGTTEKPTNQITTSATTHITVTVPKPVSERIPGEKSRQKCKEYEELAYVYEKPPTLKPGQKFLKRSVCPWQPGVPPVIIDGELAELGEFSHMALIGYKSDNIIEWDCAGSLISEDFVLTAGHCLYSPSYGTPVVVRIGDLNYTNPNDNTYAQQIPIDLLFENPGYNYPETYNDIALLKLARSVKLNEFLKPICLHTDPDTNKLDKVILTGWGFAEYGGERNDFLMKVALDMFPFEGCNKTFRRDKRLPRGIDEKLQMCAGSFDDRKDTCQGDEGAPIQIRSSEYHCSYYILGTTSFGKQCNTPSVPTVYAKVYPHLKWIEDIVWP